MAEKLKQRFRRLSVDDLVVQLYDTGISQSLIVHVSFLLILSCIISVKEAPKKPICITLSEPEQTVEYTNVLEEPTEIVMSETETKDQEEKQLSESIAKAMSEEGSGSEIDIKIEDLLLEDKSEENTNDLLASLDHNELTEEIAVAEAPKIKEPTVRRRYTNNIRPANRTGLDPLMQSLGQQQGQGSGESGIGFGGDVAELDRRLQHFGARTGDVQISLSWNSVDDIDLHVIVMPIRSQINWTNKRGPCGGMLDIDMNAHPQMVSNRPIENVFWPDNQAPQGMYIVGIQNYMPWSRNLRTEVLVVVKIKGKVVQSKKVIVGYGEGVKEVLRFNF